MNEVILSLCKVLVIEFVYKLFFLCFITYTWFIFFKIPANCLSCCLPTLTLHLQTIPERLGVYGTLTHQLVHVKIKQSACGAHARGWSLSSGVEKLPCMRMALGLIPRSPRKSRSLLAVPRPCPRHASNCTDVTCPSNTQQSAACRQSSHHGPDRSAVERAVENSSLDLQS